jgi:lysophospholipase L1-like esterase
MYKKAFIISLLLNILVIVYVLLKVKTPKVEPVTYRKNVLKSLPITKDDIVFIGDSETERFELYELLKNPNVKNRGVGSEFTEGVLKRIDHISAAHPKEIFLMIGINDLINKVPTTQALQNINQIIQRIKSSSPETKIFIQSVLPTNRASGDTIIVFNKQLSALAGRSNVTYINLYDLFNNNGSLKYDCGDGLHVSGEGYIKWAQVLKQYLI